MRIVRAICAIIFIAGLGLLALALHGYREQSRFIDGAAQANGEITEVNRHVSSGPRKGTSTYYSFRVRFAPAGEPLDATVTDTSSSPRFAVGEKVALLYAREDPRQVNIDDFAMLWADAVVLLIIAAVLLAAGGTAFWLAGGRPTGRGRSEASLPEMQRAWREGRLTRDSQFQPVLIGFALAGFPLLGAAIAFVLFAPGVVQAIVVAILAWIAIAVIRDKRRARSAKSQRR